jgi:glycosyltransferase involved in cell wall biosynthesis
MSVSVVLPCLNEVQSVGLCVTEALETFAGAGIDGEVLIVDNGSTDGSQDVAAKAGARVVHELRPGYGSALLTGFEQARGDVIVMADADFTYDLRKVPELVAPIMRDEADLVFGSRLDAATNSTMPWMHRLIGTPTLTFLAARASGKRVVKDSQSGFRAFRRDRIASLGLRATGMELTSDMLIRATRAEWRITEIEAGYRPRIGESKLATWSDGLRNLKVILLLAPDLLLVGPGAALIALGVVTMILGFVRPEGVDVGSLRWQPVFFSGIALVLGVQAFLAGAVLAYYSPVAAPGARRRFDFVGRPTFPMRCFALGLLFVAIGLIVDVVLITFWLTGEPAPPDRGFGVASLAQSLIIIGSTLATFGIVNRFMRALAYRQRAGRARADDDRRATTPVPDTSADL